MAKIEAKKLQAQDYYFKGSFTQKEISKIVDVTEKTISKWVKEGNWDDGKNLQTITKKQLLKESYLQLNAVNEAIKANKYVPTKEQYDAKSIIGKEIDRLSNRPLAAYTDVFTDFVEFLKNHYPKHIELFGKISMEFLETKTSERND